MWLFPSGIWSQATVTVSNQSSCIFPVHAFVSLFIDWYLVSKPNTMKILHSNLNLFATCFCVLSMSSCHWILKYTHSQSFSLSFWCLIQNPSRIDRQWKCSLDIERETPLCGTEHVLDLSLNYFSTDSPPFISGLLR